MDSPYYGQRFNFLHGVLKHPVFPVPPWVDSGP